MILYWLTRAPLKFAAFGLPTSPYFNAGVLLVDRAACQRLGIEDEIVTAKQTYRDVLFCLDQSLLNFVSRKRWVELSSVWNWQFNYRVDLLTQVVGPVLIHFSGAQKVWDDPHGVLPRPYRALYRRNQGSDNEAPLPTTDDKQVRRHLLTNLWYLKSTLADVNRFRTTIYVLLPKVV